MAQPASVATRDEQWAIQAIVHGHHHDPFSYLGMHQVADSLVVRAFLPQARDVTLIDTQGKPIAAFERIDPAGLFVAHLKTTKPFPYRLRVDNTEIEDPYRFPPLLGAMDFHLIAEGSHLELYRRLGAHEATIDDVPGVVFSVWAPNARRVSVVGPFNDWDGRRHPMRCHFGIGVWELFLPGLTTGTLYKYEIRGVNGDVLPLKADPLALRAEHPPSLHPSSARFRRHRPIRRGRSAGPRSMRATRRCRFSKCISAPGVARTETACSPIANLPISSCRTPRIWASPISS